MPLVRITQPPGQSPEQKKDLVRALTDVYCSATGSAPDSVWIIIEEISRDDWAIGGTTVAERAKR